MALRVMAQRSQHIARIYARQSGSVRLEWEITHTLELLERMKPHLVAARAAVAPPKKEE